MASSFQLFDPSQPCSSYIPLNPVENKLTFYKVQVFDVSLEDIADLADLPAAYALGAPQAGAKAKMRLGLPLAMLFSELSHTYQRVNVNDAPSKKMPVVLSLEGSFLPFDPKRPQKAPLPERRVSLEEVAKRQFDIDGKMVELSQRDQRRLASDGVALVKVNGRTTRLKIDRAAPSARRTAMARSAGGQRRIDPTDFVGYAPNEWPDDLYDEAMLALLADRRSGSSGFTASEEMAEVVSSLPDHIYRGVLRAFKNDPRFIDLLLRLKRGPLGAIHYRPKLPRYDIGLFTAFEQAWLLQGYSRGSLVSSLTLAPQEELTIEIFTFDRRKVEEERTLTSEFERNSELSAMSNITGMIARELSETTRMSGDVGLGIPIPAGSLPVDVSVGATASSDVKADIQASLEQVSEVTSRVTTRVKSTRQVKVLEARETGREDRITRRIRNPNQGHALTLNCYEVLENYKVDTTLLSSKQFCLLVEPPDLGVVDVAFVLAYQDRLQQALLSKAYLAGFDAARSLYAQGWFDTASIQKAEIEEAANQSIAATAPPAPEKPIIVVSRQLAKALGKLFDADLMEAAGVLAEYYNPFDGADVTDKEKAAAEAALGLFNYAFKLRMVSPGIEDRARTFMTAMEDDSSEAAVVEAVGAFLAGADDEWLTNLKMLAASLVSANLASMLAIPFPVLVPVMLSLAVIENNAGYPALVGKAKQELKAHETAASVVLPASDASSADDIKTKEPPPQLFSLQELAMAHADFDALRLHIEANRTYYMNQLWRAEDPNSRFERLRQMGIESYVENRLIGFVGERAIFPLRLSALDQVVRNELLQRLTSFDPVGVDTVGSGSQAVSVGPIQVGSQQFALPTSSVYMDGALGLCELLEPYLVERRDIERRIALAEAQMAEARVASAQQAIGMDGSEPAAIGLSAREDDIG